MSAPVLEVAGWIRRRALGRRIAGLAGRAVITLLLIAVAVIGAVPARGQSVGWKQLVPAPRYNSAMVYDVARGVTVLFGGQITQYEGGVSGETWEWNGNSWTQRVVGGPSPRSGHAMAYDSVRGVTVLFGGDTGDNPFANGETWEWNGTC